MAGPRTITGNQRALVAADFDFDLSGSIDATEEALFRQLDKNADGRVTVGEPSADSLEALRKHGVRYSASARAGQAEAQAARGERDGFFARTFAGVGSKFDALNDASRARRVYDTVLVLAEPKSYAGALQRQVAKTRADSFYNRASADEQHRDCKARGEAIVGYMTTTAEHGLETGEQLKASLANFTGGPCSKGGAAK